MSNIGQKDEICPISLVGLPPLVMLSARTSETIQLYAVGDAPMKLNINSRLVEVGDDPEMPLLWALRDIAGMKGTKFGCGIAACGACTVHVDGAPVRSCQLAVGDVDGPVTTIEGIGNTENLHAVQQAWVEEQVPQCG